ncbi:MAG: serine/threonine protein kinase/WD40 repeat-containing protein, partial [bacterium]
MKECPICHTCFGDRMEVCNNDKSLLLDLIPGASVIDNKYRLDKKIGIGRVGIVFQATVMKTGEVVAIKVISPNLVTADSSLPERFLILIRAFASLDHVNIVKVFDFGQTEENILYFVMEYLSGTNLAELLQQQKQLSLELALSVSSKICEAIANAHRSGVYHLDLKPSNVFVCDGKDGQQIVKVVDFGMVRLKVPSLISQLSPMQRDYVLGKPYYFAPEQFTTDQIDLRSEVYAIGAILYHLLAGNPPFTGGSYPMLKMQHIGVTPPALREIRPEIPPTLESIIIKALEKRSSQRHSSVIALAIQLSAQLAKYRESLLNQISHASSTSSGLPIPPEPFYSNDPTPAPLGKYTTKSGIDNTLAALPNPPEPFYSGDPTPAPTLERPRALAFKLGDTLGALPIPPEPFYSGDPTPAPIAKYSPIFVSNDTLAALPSPPEPFYSSDPTPPPIAEDPQSFLIKMKETLEDFSKSPESFRSNELISSSSDERSLSTSVKLEETLGAFPEASDYSREETPIIDTTTVCEVAKDNSNPINKSYGITAPVYSIPSLIAPTLRIEEGSIVTRPLASESFYVGEAFDEVSQKSIEVEIQTFEQVDIDKAFEQAGIGEMAERTSISKFLAFPSSIQSPLSTPVYELSPNAIIYLFVEQFVPALLSGQRGRQTHSNFTAERERLAALLLTTALFSLACRGVVEVSIGSGSSQKKQIALSQHEGFIVRGVNL